MAGAYAHSDRHTHTHSLSPSPLSVAVSDASSRPNWSSFFLALGSDVAVRMQHPGHTSLPSEPNVLQLHRAVTQSHWPTELNGQPLPPPTLYGRHVSTYPGSQYRSIFDACALAREEHINEFGGGIPSQGTVILGNPGTGKSMALLVHMSSLLQPVAGQDRPTIIFACHMHGPAAASVGGALSPALVTRLRGALAPSPDEPPPRLGLDDIQYAHTIAPFFESLRLDT